MANDTLDIFVTLSVSASLEIPWSSERSIRFRDLAEFRSFQGPGYGSKKKTATPVSSSEGTGSTKEKPDITYFKHALTDVYLPAAFVQLGRIKPFVSLPTGVIVNRGTKWLPSVSYNSKVPFDGTLTSMAKAPAQLAYDCITIWNIITGNRLELVTTGVIAFVQKLTPLKGSIRAFLQAFEKADIPINCEFSKFGTYREICDRFNDFETISTHQPSLYKRPDEATPKRAYVENIMGNLDVSLLCSLSRPLTPLFLGRKRDRQACSNQLPLSDCL
jgi:hypothetical protein